MSSTQEIELSVVIPVYNSETILPHLIERLQASLPKTGHSFEIILVCDSSPDDSWSVIQQLVSTSPAVKGLLLGVNAGQHNALMAGFQQAEGRFIVTMDDDLQHDPDDVPEMLQVLKDGADVVYARFRSRQHPTWKVLGSRLNDVVAGFLIDKPKDLYLSPFRAFRVSVRDEILRYRGPYVYVDGLILGATRKIRTIEVDHHERFGGESHYGLVKSISLWLKMATSFSIIPLRITSMLGILFAGAGFLLALLFIIQKFTIDAMPDGWSSLIVTILIIGGVQLMALGMLGEYLGRVLLTLNARPQYVVSETSGFDES